ncbi:FAD-binding domain-containing protein [Roridomyces roridus]|uniref:FAD-binding domain-containing protein n=1 Tax=Roridomyces roridus TaxID=1738132 RepID=A0AAD7FFJ6_9AGAR|nr:FAD-binding domain-containing protein [Roridomyces roridus]
MAPSTRTLTTAALLILFQTLPSNAAGTVDVCLQIQEAISSASAVYFPGDLLGNYAVDLSHWASSSSQLAACSVEPGTADDVAAIIKTLGSTNTSFAVKGGGHTANPGFSSTTPTIRTGLVWDSVYEALEPFGVNIVGGRVSGVGVAGFTLGGGYSWKTNQFGLTVDSVTEFELVKPNGDIVTVTPTSEPDLFFGLTGGGNNFGIMTQFTLKTHPQGQVWGGLILYTEDQLPAVSDAIAAFANNVTDPKAAIIPAINFLLGAPGVSHLMFYDGLTPPSGIFDNFLAIPALLTDVSTRSFLSLVQAAPSNVTTGERGFFHTVSLLDYTPNIISAIINETKFWGSALTLAGATFISYDIEPFLPTLYTHGAPGVTTAYPPSRTNPGAIPLNLYFAWALPTSDSIIHDALVASAQQLMSVAQGEGQDLSKLGLYTNYALYDTPLERICGANLPRLREIRASVDPEGVMALAGGWKF